MGIQCNDAIIWEYGNYKVAMMYFAIQFPVQVRASVIRIIKSWIHITLMSFPCFGKWARPYTSLNLYLLNRKLKIVIPKS